MRKYCITIACFVLCNTSLIAQKNSLKKDTIYSTAIHQKMLDILITENIYHLINSFDKADLVYIKDSCGTKIPYFFMRVEPGSAEQIRQKNNQPYFVKDPFLKIHGSLQYNLDYRGVVDTPYFQRNVYQHTVRAYVEITLKNQYPLKVFITNRVSNSLIAKNFYDVNLQYNPQDFIRKIKEDINKKIKNSVSLDDLNSCKKQIEAKTKDISELKKWIRNSSTLQKLVEEREELILQQEKKKSKKSFKKNELDSSSVSESPFMNEFELKKKKLDSLEQDLNTLEHEYDRKKHKYNNGVAKSKVELDRIQSLPELKRKLKEYDIADSILPKGYKYLFAIRSFGIGRNAIDYSELSAKNISITGVSIEYNPSWYVAFATGGIEYRFRDYVLRKDNQPKQYLSLIRAGYGIKNSKSLIFTYYQGKRELNNSSSLQGQNVPGSKLLGYTLEGTYRMDNNNYIIAEAAKSSLPSYISSTAEQKLFATALKFDEHSNEAYSVKLYSYFPATFTKVIASFKRIGGNFQSFSVFTSGSSQSSWNVRADQLLFKKKLSVALGLRTNEFANPYIGNNFKSTAVFKTFQATLRLKKFPIISIGYYPNSQLTKLSENKFVENLFYTLTATASHFYQSRDWLFNSSIVYTQFYNKATDSGFAYFNSKNFLLTQNAFINKFCLSANVSALINYEYNIYTTAGSLDYKLNKNFSLGAGIKYNHQTVFNSTKLGYSGNISVSIPYFGNFRLDVDKAFIPSNDKQLTVNNTGQLTYFKTF